MSKRSEQKGARKVHCCSDKMQSTTKDERRKEFKLLQICFFLDQRSNVSARHAISSHVGSKSKQILQCYPNGHCVTATTVVTLTVQSFRIYVNRTQCDWDWALCTLRQAIPDLCAFQCHLLGMSSHIESTMPAAKTADKKASTETLYASMLNSIADFRESQLIHSYSMDRLCRLPPRAHKDKLGITGSYSSLARKVNLCPSEDTSRPDSKHAKTGWRRS